MMGTRVVFLPSYFSNSSSRNPGGARFRIRLGSWWSALVQEFNGHVVELIDPWQFPGGAPKVTEHDSEKLPVHCAANTFFIPFAAPALASQSSAAHPGIPGGARFQIQHGSSLWPAFRRRSLWRCATKAVTRCNSFSDLCMVSEMRKPESSTEL